MAETNGKPNGKTPMQKFALESTGLGLAEFSSMATSLGTVAVFDTIAPDLVHSTSKALAKIVFEPYLENIEKFMGKVCRLEECKPDKSKSREERAEKLARVTVLWLPAFVASFAAKIATRRGTNRILEVSQSSAKWWEIWKLTKHEKSTIMWDEGMHLGSMLFLNTVGAKYSDEMLRSTRSMLGKMGFSDQKANDIASMAVVWELPNLIGLGAGVGEVAHHHLGSSNADKLRGIMPGTHGHSH